MQWKSDIRFEEYLIKVNIKKFRTALSRFRCSSHVLFIEIGRYKGVSREKDYVTFVIMEK